jgi:hypothetical protein
MVKTQYEKNIDIADTHTSGRAVIRIIERDIRMAGYEHRDSSGNKTFSTGITNQLVLNESNNACCDGVSVVYDHPTDTEDGVERRRINYSVGEFPGTEEVDYELLDSDTTRYRLYKQIDIIGEDGVIFPTEEIGTEQVLADFVEDLQFYNISTSSDLYAGNDSYGTGAVYDPVTRERVRYFEFGRTVSALAFGPDGLLYRGSDGYSFISIHDPLTGALVGEISPTIWINAMAFGPDGLLYAGNDSYGTGAVYDPVTRERVRYFEFDRTVSALAFGPDGLLYRGSDGYSFISIHDPLTGALVGEISPTIWINAMAFKNNTIGKESLVNIKLTLRSKNKQHTADKTYTKEVDEEHHIGNYNFEFNDKYKRDVFFSTVAVRNMLL